MRHRQSLKPVYACVLLALSSTTALANPLDPTVVSGQASFASSGNTLTVTNTPGTVINWQGFSIGANETTRFAQQSASSAVLNRVVSNDPSKILGTLQSNGRVFLINPNGIVFGAGAVIDVAGLVASTLNLSDADFLAGRNSFTQVPGAANVSNAGNITARGDGQSGGQVFLIAPNVENTGVITAPNGEILLAAGYSVDLVSTSDPNLRVNITAPAGDATNVGQLIASSGSLGLFGTVVRNSGTVSADSATLQGGKIVFRASQLAQVGGTVSATGTSGGSIQALGNEVQVTAGALLDASGANGGGTVLVGGDAHGANPNVQNAQTTFVDATATIKADATQNGNGGKVVVWSDNATQFNGNISAQGGGFSGNGGWVEVSGKQKLGYAGLTNTLAANGLSGTLLLDPADFLILAAGGDMTGAALSFALSLANVIITTTSTVATVTGATVTPLNGGTLGDIYVSDTVSWANTSTLTLNSYGSVFLNSAITAASGSLILNAGVGGLPTTYIVDVGSLQLASLVANAPAGGTGTTLTGTINTLGALDVQTGGVTGTGTLNVGSGTTSLTGTFTANMLNMTGGTLSLDGAATTTLPTLNLSSGTLTGTGNIVIPNSSATGIFNWTGGTLSGTGSFTTTPGSGPVAGFQPTATTMNGTLTLSRPFINYGGMSQGAGALNLMVTPAGSLTNSATGTLILGNGATGGTLIVNGILSNLGGLGAVGTGISSVDASGATIGTISNSGTVGVAAGTAINAGATLNWTAGAAQTNTGTWGIGSTTTPMNGGVLNLGVAPLGGTQTYSGAFTNVGTVNVNSGTNILSGAFTNNGTLQFATGINSLTGTYSEAQLSGGYAPTITFTSGTNTISALDQAGGALTLNSLSVNGGVNYLNTDSTITSLSIGAATLTGLGNITIPTTGVFNWSGGTLATTGAATITLNNVTNPTTLYQGTLNLNRALINNGTVSQQSVNQGWETILNIGAGGSFTNNGTFNLGNGANIGTVNVSDTGVFTNGATGIINSSGIVTNTIQAVLGTTVGTIANNGAINVAAGNTLNYLGGQTATNAGTFTTAAGGVLNLGAGTGAPAGAAYIYGGTITNDGALNFIGGTNNLTGIVTGTGIATVPVGVALNVTGGTMGSPLVNNGTMYFSGAGNNVTGTLTQNGLLVVAPGATLAAPSFTNTGTLAGGGTLNLGTGTLTNNGIIAPGGAGTINGTLAITGSLVMGAGSSLNLDINGIGAGQYDVLNVSGTADLTNGALNLYGVGVAGSYTVLTVTGGLGGTTFGTINSGTFTQTPTYSATDLTLAVTANSLTGYMYWTGGAGTSDWADASNWSNSAAPTLADNLYISPSANTVFITTGAQSGNNLFCDANLNLAGGSLALTGSLNLPGTFTVSGGNWIQVAAALPAFNVGDFSFTGGTFIRALGGDGSIATPYQLTDIYGVQGMASGLGNSYALANSIDASGTVKWNAGGGFLPIGLLDIPYTGRFNGQGYTISNLTINRPASAYVGLFGWVGFGGAVSNLGLLGSNVIASGTVGAIAGSNNGNISNSYVSGGTVNGGSSTVGGLVGYNYGSISNSYSSGVKVSGYQDVGGLAGQNSGTISDTYSSGGTVNGIWWSGGLVGENWNIINTSYSTNAVAAGSSNGGLIGWDEMGTVYNSYWDIQTSGLATSGGPETGLTTAQMMTMASFAGWSIANTGGAGATWRIYEGQTTPLLTSFLKPLTIAAGSVSAVYTGTAYTGPLVNPVYSPTSPDSTHLLGNAYGNAINVGTYAPATYSDQQGYDISFVNGVLTITPAIVSFSPLGITANNASKTYGTTLTFAGTEFTPVGLLGTDAIGSVTLTSLGAVATANAGSYAITPSAAAFKVGSASNYTITYVDGVLKVTPVNVTIAANAATKVYGDADALTFTVSGLMSWDTNATAFTGALGRDVGENVGTYAINNTGTLASKNYTFTGITTNNLIITQAPLTVTANATSKILNTADPLLTYTVSGLKFTDTAATTLNGGSLSRVPGETVGAYQINQGKLGLISTNYTMAYVSASLTILVPTVINEIVDISNQRPKKLEDVLAVNIPTGNGGNTPTLPMCN